MTGFSSTLRPPRPRPLARRAAVRHLLRRAALLCLFLLVLLPLTAIPARGVAAPVPADGAAQGRWIWPTSGPHEVARPYEEPPGPYAPGHRGVDLSADDGSEVLAVEDGTVRFAGPVAGRGVVSIRHADGLLSTYEPVDASVSAGDTVRAGDVIGTVSSAGSGGGDSHCAPASCVHLGARRGDTYQDPYPLLMGARPSVLLPLRAGAGVMAVLDGANGAITGDHRASAQARG
jgi:murein DD-endopeptidase MepM/ murein hydrolase activator NlpD